MKKKFDYSSFEQESIERLKNGEALLGKDGILTPLIKQFLEKALEGEIENHLTDQERTATGNRRNGKRSKTVKTSSG